jgi:hypothetical protein
VYYWIDVFAIHQQLQLPVAANYGSNRNQSPERLPLGLLGGASPHASPSRQSHNGGGGAHLSLAETSPQSFAHVIRESQAVVFTVHPLLQPATPHRLWCLVSHTPCGLRASRLFRPFQEPFLSTLTLLTPILSPFPSHLLPLPLPLAV